MKNLNLIGNKTMNGEFIIVEWPESQRLMDKEGFEDNCCLINSEPFLEEHGPEAYFVNKEWLSKIDE